VPLVFFALSLLGAALILAYINCRITYDEQGFDVSNLLGVERRFTYESLTAIQEDSDVYLYEGERRVTVDMLFVGAIEFIAHVRKRYRTLHNGNKLPEIRKKKKDIFNGNVRDSASFVFAYILLTLVFVVAGGVLLYFLHTPKTVNNTTAQHVIFESCEIHSDEIILTTSDSKPCRIRFLDKTFSSAEIEAICNGRTEVTIYTTKVTPKHDEDYDQIHAIFLGDTELLSFDTTDRLYRNEYTPLLIVLLIALLLWIGAMAASIIVGRNPKKYKKLVPLFFKNGCVKY
jgi:NADH:ubiquinone oxidoreductase subunit 3 (subunit A)